MKQIFTPKVRDIAIETTCSYLIMARILKRGEVLGYMRRISQLNDSELAEQLLASRILYDDYLEKCWNMN